MSEPINLAADAATTTKKRSREDPQRMVCRVCVLNDDAHDEIMAFFPEADLTAEHREWLELLRNRAYEDIPEEASAWLVTWTESSDVPEGCVVTSNILDLRGMLYPDCC